MPHCARHDTANASSSVCECPCAWRVKIETKTQTKRRTKRSDALASFRMVMFACAAKTVFISSRISESLFWPEFHIGSVVQRRFNSILSTRSTKKPPQIFHRIANSKTILSVRTLNWAQDNRVGIENIYSSKVSCLPQYIYFHDAAVQQMQYYFSIFHPNVRPPRCVRMHSSVHISTAAPSDFGNRRICAPHTKNSKRI